MRLFPRGKGRGPDIGVLARFAIFAIVTGLLTVFIAAQIMGSTFAARYTLTATFDDVTGLLPGDAVKVAGSPVGQVDGVKVVLGRAVVTMKVDKDVKLPDDSTAAIRWRNIIGQRMIYLVPGQSPAFFRDGDRVAHTQSVVDLSDIVNSLGPLTRNLDPNQLNQVLEAFSTMLDGNEGNINLTIANLQGLLDTFATRQQTIGQMVKDYKTLSDVAVARDKEIAAAVDNLASLTQFFAGNQQTLDNAVTTISTTTSDLNAVLGGREAQLGRIIASLSQFTGTFRMNVNELEKMVQELPYALRELFQTANGGHFLRTNALCINIQPGPCPFKMQIPGATTGGSPTPTDLIALQKMLMGGK